MQTKKITSEQVQKASQGSTTITEVAGNLGLLKGKLDGRTARMIRTAAPDINDILKSNRVGTSTESTATKSGKVSPDTVAEPDNPYRPNSTYAAIFTEGSRRYMTKAELIAKVAAMTGKSVKCVGFSLSVLCHKDHSSNLGRSTFLRDEDGRIKLMAIRRRN